MRKIFLPVFALVISAAFVCLSAEPPEKLEKLKLKKSEISQQIFNRRVKLIEEDPKLRELHEKIISLHKELAVRLESDRETSDLLKQLKEIDAEIERLGHEKN